MCAALFSYVWRSGVKCHGVDDRPGESCSSRGIVARPVLIQERRRGWWRRGWLSGRCPRAGSRVPSTEVRTWYSGRHGDVPSPCAPTASGMSSQYQAWRCSGGDGRTGLTATGPLPPARRHGVVLCSHGKSIRGFHRPPSRARRVSRTGVGGKVSRS
jgi:hypothetical protein